MFLHRCRETGGQIIPAHAIADILVGLRDRAAAKEFLDALLTPSEMARLDLRWRLVRMLVAGVPQREIAKKLGISLCKITRGSRELKSRPAFRKIVVEYGRNIKRKGKR